MDNKYKLLAGVNTVMDTTMFKATEMQMCVSRLLTAAVR